MYMYSEFLRKSLEFRVMKIFFKVGLLEKWV